MKGNELKDKLENEVIYRVLKVNVPVAVWDIQFPEVNEFCKQNFMDNRWSMIWTLVKAEKEDYKFAMLYDKISELESEIGELKFKLNEPVKQETKKVKTFGGGNI